MPLAVLKTNLTSLDSRFCMKFEQFITNMLGCDPALTMVEVHTGIATMSRNQSHAPMLNLEFHHNEEKIQALTKKEYASKFAEFLQREVQVPASRILVLFFDTRCTTLEATAL